MHMSTALCLRDDIFVKFTKVGTLLCIKKKSVKVFMIHSWCGARIKLQTKNETSKT